MRTPTKAYHDSPATHRRYQPQPLQQVRRRSKGWCESGDLKSVYRGDVNGSKDSLISGGSHRSTRLSVSSSRSSGTLSSSRGSLENLVDNASYPQIILNNNRTKHSPSKPHPGIVNQAKSIFEKLSHEPNAMSPSPDAHHQYSRGSREDLEKMSRVRRTPSDDADRYSARDTSRSPFYQSGSNSRRSSFSPPPMDKNANVPSSWRTGAYGGGAEENNNNRDAKYKFSDAKIVKTNLDVRRQEPKVSDPPLRDSSSVQAVKNYQTRPHSASSPVS